MKKHFSTDLGKGQNHLYCDWKVANARILPSYGKICCDKKGTYPYGISTT